MLLYLVKTVITLISLSSVSESGYGVLWGFSLRYLFYVLFEGLFMIGHIRDFQSEKSSQVNGHSVPFIVFRRKYMVC